MPEIKDSGKRYVNENGGQRDTSEGKPNFNLIPYEEIKRLAYHYSVGLKKYGNEKEVEEWRLSGILIGVECSSFGNIRYLESKKEVSQWHNRFGYKLITLVGRNIDKSSKKKHYQVHRLILEAFYGNSNLIVNHKDGVKDNNHIDNLEYLTQSDNIKHSRDILYGKASREGTGRISFEVAEEIRERVYNGEKQKELAVEYGISCQYVNSIMKKRCFAKKYEKKYIVEKFNWKKLNTEQDLERFMESALRHLFSWLNGEKDEDHAMACVFNIFAYEWHTFNNEEKRKKYVSNVLKNNKELLNFETEAKNK